MPGDAVYRIIQLVKISARQLQLPVFAGVAVKYFRAVIITLSFIDQLPIPVHNHQFVIRVLADIVDLQKVINTIPVW